MKIDRKLNLVVPVERDDGVTVYVHAAPISREAFDSNFLLIAKAFTALHTEGLGHIAGPRVAAKLLKSTAADMGQADAYEKGLLAEMRRLTNVVAPTEQGWTTLPLYVATQQGTIDPADVEEVENAIAFFTLISAMHKRKASTVILTQAARLWGAQVTPSSCTELTASLQTSTPGAATGQSPTAVLSSIPS